MQVHVKQAAVSHMLCNDEKLRGMARKVQLLAAREAAVSAALPPQQVRMHAPLPLTRLANSYRDVD